MDFSGWKATDFAAVISAFTALVAITITPLVQILIQRWQRSGTIASRRQQRVDLLLAELAGFVTAVAELQELKFRIHMLIGVLKKQRDVDTARLLDEERKTFSEVHHRTMTLAQILRLKLNPSDDHQKPILASIQKLADASKDPDQIGNDVEEKAALAEFRKQLHAVVSHAGSYFRDENEAIDRL